MANGVAIGLGTMAGVTTALLAAWHIGIWWEVDKKCEKPKYSVIRTLGTKKDWLGRSRPVAEIRRYAPVLVAEVTFNGMGMRDALQSGFRQIAGFIFGKNIAPGSDAESSKVAMTSPVTLEATSEVPTSAKIAMTAPVTSEMVDATTYKVSFVMPSHYTKDTLPKPLNENVKIKEIPARTLAAIAWRGKSPTEEQMHARTAELKAELESVGIKSHGSIHLWQYHPPFAPYYMRLNEVLVDVEDDTVAKS